MSARSLSGLLSRRPTAIVSWVGRNMNCMLRPNVPEPLLSSKVCLSRAANETVTYSQALVANQIQTILLGVPPELVDDITARVAEKAADPALFFPVVDDEFRRWGDEEDAADGVFPEDWLRNLQCPLSGENFFISAHMTAPTRIGEHSMGVQTLIRLGLISAERVIYLVENNQEARCETGDILQPWINSQPITIFGVSERSNDHAFYTWRQISQERQFGEVYRVSVYPNRGLHLTTGSGMLNQSTVLYDPTLISGEDLAAIPGLELVEVAPEDRGQQNAANCLYLPTSGAVAMDDRFPRTIERVRARGFTVIPLPNEEHAKGAGGLTCRSLRTNWFAQTQA